MSILDLLRKKKLSPSASSAEVEAALDKVLAELPAAREAYEAAELHRDDLVLDGWRLTVLRRTRNRVAEIRLVREPVQPS